MKKSELTVRIAIAAACFVAARESNTGEMVTSSGLLIISILAAMDLAVTDLEQPKALPMWAFRWSGFAATCSGIAYSVDALSGTPGAALKATVSIGISVLIFLTRTRLAASWRSSVLEIVIKPAGTLAVVLVYSLLHSASPQSTSILGSFEDAIVSLAFACDAVLRFAYRATLLPAECSISQQAIERHWGQLLLMAIALVGGALVYVVAKPSYDASVEDFERISKAVIPRREDEIAKFVEGPLDDPGDAGSKHEPITHPSSVAE